MKHQQPPAIMLILAHDILLFYLMMHRVPHGVEFMVHLVSFIAVLMISSFIHAGYWTYLEKRSAYWVRTGKRPMNNMARIAGFFIPLAGILLIGLIGMLFQDDTDHKSPLLSPSKRYTMRMTVENGFQIVNIYDQTGKQLYHDTNSHFDKNHHVTWSWDDKDCLWLSNTDDGMTYYWVNSSKGWQKHWVGEHKSSP